MPAASVPPARDRSARPKAPRAKAPMPPMPELSRLSLRRLDHRHADLANHLLVRAARHSHAAQGVAQEWHWLAQAAALAPADELLLSDGEATCVLALHPLSSAGVDSGIELQAFQGESLVLAATMRFAGVIDHLAALTGRPWHLQSMRRAHEPSASAARGDLMQVAFTLLETDSPDRVSTGYVGVRGDDAQHWLAARGISAPVAHGLQELRLPLGVVLNAAVELSSAELRRLEPGAAVLIGRYGADGAACLLTLPGGAGHLHTQLQGHRLVAQGPLLAGPPPRPDHSRRDLMQSEFDHEDGFASAADASRQPTAGGVFDTVPVAVEFHLGALTLPLGDLAVELTEGRVFDLGQPLGPHSVALRAGGVELARGELLQVGDLLAVRITKVTKVNASGPV
jgi:flagellar motor switch/type III secretory pathway protein FliN